MAARQMTGCQICMGNLTSNVGTFGHVVAGHLQVDTGRITDFYLMHDEKLMLVAEDIVELARFETGAGFHRTAVHRIGQPDHVVSFALHRAN